MKHTNLPFGIDREGFERWGNGLAAITNSFDLSMPFNGKCSPSNVTYEAEQAACAIGYAPWYEVGEPSNYELEDSISGLRTFEAGGWNSYALDIVCQDKNLGIWIGSQHWGKVDNTAKGAGQRILYALENGVPEQSYIMKMMSGDIPLCYSSVIVNKQEPIDVKKWFNVSEMTKERELESV